MLGIAIIAIIVLVRKYRKRDDEMLGLECRMQEMQLALNQRQPQQRNNGMQRRNVRGRSETPPVPPRSRNDEEQVEQPGDSEDDRYGEDNNRPVMTTDIAEPRASSASAATPTPRVYDDADYQRC